MKSEPITEIDASAEESLSSKKGKDNLDVGRSPKDSLDLVTRKTSEIRRRPYGIVLGDLVGIDESGVAELLDRGAPSGRRQQHPPLGGVARRIV